MATLHIEHPVTDFGAWRAAFDRFAEARAKSGVRGHRSVVTGHPAERPGYLRPVPVQAPWWTGVRPGNG